MAFLAWTFGILGGLCAVVGILTAVAVIPEVAALTWTFWLMVSAILLLACIAFAIASGSYE